MHKHENATQIGTYLPPARCIVCGHRVAVMPGCRPIATRKLNWRFWLVEHAMRYIARSVGKHPEFCKVEEHV
jgi:hypothetical protein